MGKIRKISLHITEALYIEVKLMSVLTKRTMSKFVRLSLMDKIRELKQKK